ncbi:sugar/nucleoside kinase (ribokinase family) [Paenibacillus shirakamiensis]|uniref:Sugar/nucleoside kinase (Ribokinase family) n=1 Tax=Paenibacillus shirakamiensis TaxID=1265935 RepID=A0ABS4JMS9_9BACL|nr:carbohydrate kinase [Paenibacillus shirakamiensis]MBP2001914.1 sugar/nucleoside kinase (ribokinase family) [Paenibacillus shirakamiensis]
MPDITAIGELLVDFTPYGLSELGQPLFERNPGGAPANVAAAIVKLGRTAEFIGKIGDDAFGQGLKSVLDARGVGTAGLILTKEANTTLAFVHLDDQGDRSFSFYRHPGADQLLREEEIPYAILDASSIVHFGSVSMSDEPSRGATLAAVRYARQKGLRISYDPNLRSALWGSLDEAKQWILEGMKYADIVKVSEEELEFLTGSTDLEKGSRLLAGPFATELLLVTLGDKGSYYRAGELVGLVPGNLVQAVDTTGAGDAFFGGLLYGLLEDGRKVNYWSSSELERLLRFANATGALATTRKGGIPAMPTLEEVLASMK